LALLDLGQGARVFDSELGPGYREAAMLPFSHDAFIDFFRVYNTAIWPAQVVATLSARGFFSC
jgi:hypothetical protein